MSTEAYLSGTSSSNYSVEGLTTPDISPLDNVQREALKSDTLQLKRSLGLRKAPLTLSVLLTLGLLASSLPIFQHQPSSAYGAENNPTLTPTPTSTLILERTPTPIPTLTLTPQAKRIIAAINNPYYYVSKDNINTRIRIFNGTTGFGSNNPLRRVDTLEKCEDPTQTQNWTNCIYFQPDETKFPETQASTNVGIAVFTIVVKRFNNTDVGFVPISINGTGFQLNTWYPRTLRIADMNNVTNYSLQSEYHEGLPQGGSNGTKDSITSISIPENGSVPKLILGLTDQKNPADNGDWGANLDNNLGTFTSSFVKESSTPTPTSTVTLTPTVTATRANTYRIYVPAVFK